MDILPVVKLVEELEPLEAENESDDEVEVQGDTVEMEIKDEVLPVVKTAKPSLETEDIFVDKDKPKKTPAPKKKRVMSEAQLEHLKKGREKALAVRRAKAQEKKELKELQTKKKKKDIQKLREEVGEAPVPVDPVVKSTPKITEGMPTLSQLDPAFIKKLQEDAIAGYEVKRKERKAIKKQQEETHNRNTSHMNTINNALNPPKAVKYGDKGFFNHLF